MKLLNIKEALDIYKHLHDKNPEFGMDVADERFIPEQFVILENNKRKAEGIPVRFNLYNLLLCIKGSSIRNVNQFEYNIKEHSLQLLPAGTIHHFKDTYDDPHTYVLLFEKSFIDDLDLLSYHNNYFIPIDLNIDLFTKIKSIYEEIDYEIKNKNELHIEFIKTLLTQILIILKREKLKMKVEHQLSRSDLICNQFLSLIETHIYKMKTVSEYAELIGLSSKHLSETVKDKLGQSALYFIHIRLIKEIKYLLAYTNKNIYDIALSLNFQDASQLSRFFKKNIGISPKDFRNNNLNRQH